MKRLMRAENLPVLSPSNSYSSAKVSLVTEAEGKL